MTAIVATTPSTATPTTPMSSLTESSACRGKGRCVRIDRHGPTRTRLSPAARLTTNEAVSATVTAPNPRAMSTAGTHVCPNQIGEPWEDSSAAADAGSVASAVGSGWVVGCAALVAGADGDVNVSTGEGPETSSTVVVKGRSKAFAVSLGDRGQSEPPEGLQVSFPATVRIWFDAYSPACRMTWSSYFLTTNRSSLSA